MTDGRVPMRRRAFLLSSFAMAACARIPRATLPSPGARRLSITMDDPHVAETPLLSPIARDDAIGKTLAKRTLRAALFVCGMRVDSPEGNALLARRHGRRSASTTW